MLYFVLCCNLFPYTGINQFTMEMNGAEYGNMPKCYALNMFKDFVPMQTFSELNQGDFPIWLLPV